ncbi:MAG: carboxymuconolactone decarboxylase family protein [Verrucomicrobium sp.]|nr:carboxymuconolactone decarboxylase family protein [Verrucomicrobium sp.]
MNAIDTVPAPAQEGKSRLEYDKASPDVLRAMFALEMAVRKTGIEASLLDLVKLRASQINGCAYCIDLHVREALDKGETLRRLNLLPVWHEVPHLYTSRERAAIAWTEAVTLIAQTHVPDEVFAQARQEFTETELVNLNLAVVAINGWNRFAISFRKMPDDVKH